MSVVLCPLQRTLKDSAVCTREPRTEYRSARRFVVPALLRKLGLEDLPLPAGDASVASMKTCVSAYERTAQIQ